MLNIFVSHGLRIIRNEMGSGCIYDKRGVLLF